MSLITPAALVAALRAEGVVVKEHTVNGVSWRKHHRPASTGGWDPNGQADHHTGPYSTSLGMVDLCWRGRSDLPGPLCHGVIDPTGVCHLVGFGRANHMGLVDAGFVRAIKSDALPMNKLWAPGPDSVDGNAATYGWEVMHPGNATAYPTKQIDALVRVNAAVCRAHHWTAGCVGHHKEGTRRKVDMSYKGSGGYAIRTMVAERLRHAPSWSPTAPVPAPVPVPTPVPAPTPPQTLFEGRTATKWAYGRGEVTFRNQWYVYVDVRYPAAEFATTPSLIPTSHMREILVASDWVATSAGAKVALHTLDRKPWTGKAGFSWVALGE